MVRWLGSGLAFCSGSGIFRARLCYFALAICFRFRSSSVTISLGSRTCQITMPPNSGPPNSGPPNSGSASAPSSSDLTRRRQQLRAKRRIKVYQAIWRSLAITSLAAGTVWLATSPIWLINRSDQIEVSDNHLLNDQIIQDLLPVPYPQSLLKVQPDDLAASLETHAPIKSATVSRRLIPPGLKVRVVERVPVAVAVPNTTRPVKAIPSQPAPFKELGLIDAEGYWMPRNSFQDLGVSISALPLSVRGMHPGYEASWQMIFQSVQRSPVKIMAIDWTRPSNLILHSELGAVHLGPYGPRFDDQMAALDRLRSISTQINPEKISFIDLHDPNNPVVEILQATGTRAPATQ